MDTSLFFSIHALAGQNWLLDKLIIFLGGYFIYVVLLAFLYCGYLEYRKFGIERFYWYGVALISALVARFGVASFIRLFYHRVRPFAELGVSHLLNDTAYSFPSGHTIFMFALAAATYYFNKRLAWVLVLCGLIIGLARVAGGVHYPSDILGGIILGVLTGAVVASLWRVFTRSRTPPLA